MLKQKNFLLLTLYSTFLMMQYKTITSGFYNYDWVGIETITFWDGLYKKRRMDKKPVASLGRGASPVATCWAHTRSQSCLLTKLFSFPRHPTKNVLIIFINVLILVKITIPFNLLQNCPNWFIGMFSSKLKDHTSELFLRQVYYTFFINFHILITNMIFSKWKKWLIWFFDS